MAIERINRFTVGIDAAKFRADDMRVDSVLFNLMTIGEAVKNIPDEVRAQIPEARWRDIGRFRDRVVHHYFKTDLDIVWEIVQVHLPELRQHVETILHNLPNEEDGEEQP